MKSNAVIFILLLVIVVLSGYIVILMISMGTDQFNQKHIKPFEVASQTELPMGSVTVDGLENIPVNQWFEWKSETSNSNTDGLYRQETSEDLKTGLKYYEDYCQVCHGTGDKKSKWGLATSKINEVGMVAADLPSIIPYRDDRFLFLKIENGGTVMPRLGHVVVPGIRRQIIGYLRSVELQGNAKARN